MLIDSVKLGEDEDILLEKYLKLVNSGIKTSEILVLVQNSTDKKKFTDKVLEKLQVNSFERLNIHSFFSIVYNTLIDNWCFVENSIPTKKTFILPNLVGLEVSQFILKDILKTCEVKGYNSKKSLLHQIFRRYSLIIQNNLSSNEVKHRSEILKESFGEDAEVILKKLLSDTLKMRSLDYLRQIPIFNHIYRNSDYFKNIKYLIVDDADEITPVCFEFIKYLKPRLEDWLIRFDSMGSSRCGYLSADTSIEHKLTELFGEEVQTPKKNEKTFQELNGEIIFSDVLEDKKEKLNNFTLTSLSKRAEILDFAIKDIKKLLLEGIKPSEIAIITPLQDDMLRFTLKENLKNCTPLFLSGSEKLIDNPLVKASVNILKLMQEIEIPEHDLRVILSDYAGIPLKHTCRIFEIYKTAKKLPDINLEFYNEKYRNFYDAFMEIKNKNIKLSLKIYEMFQKTVKSADESKINKFNFFIKQLRDFEKVLGEDTVKTRTLEILNQIENSIIAENPNSVLEISEENLIVATPQKIIDNKISTKYQFWLDVSHSDWVKTDTGPLYNSWVFQADWTKDEYTVEDDIFLSAQKTARILRKLLLLTKVSTKAYSSLLDPTGAENLGGIEKYLISSQENKIEEKAFSTITPRDDQKPVLDYKTGTMAVSAVPGAGKTTILLVLVMKLISSGINPANIFVLTYMESAAANFRERIKNMSPSNSLLPSISTIHGLALKIIKDNSNYERLGLDSDFDICDDTQRIRIIKSISGKYSQKDTEDFDRAISVLKLQGGNPDNGSGDKKTENFKKFFHDYQSKLAEENLIDYDDILVLSVRLLKENPDILQYYQEICKYIIEDEAQDSSSVQQQLIGLLGGKYKNLIRCGDINQAITSTFSNADTEGFREFIRTSDTHVEMNHSQRCAQDIMNLANNTVLWGEKILPNAFFKSMIQGVEGKNPKSENAVCPQVFERGFDEKNFIKKEIKNILTKDRDATVGILLRSNFQVANWTQFIANSGFKTITRSESLGQKAVFNTIFSVLKFIQNPFDNETVLTAYETLSEYGFYKPRYQNEIKDSKVPYITLNGDEEGINETSQFLWDMQYWLNSSALPAEELTIRIGLFYYTSQVEKSNVYLIATLIRRLNTSGNFTLLLERLEDLAKKPSLSGFKFFSEEDNPDDAKGKVRIMTLHKSKGDEFDFVFIPELTEKGLSIDVNKMKLKDSTLFMEKIRGFAKDYKVKNEPELKEFSASEAARLFYVGITRAKKKLYITTSTKVKSNRGEYEQEPSLVFDNLL